jgi:hypothetical protein
MVLLKVEILLSFGFGFRCLWVLIDENYVTYVLHITFYESKVETWNSSLSSDPTLVYVLWLTSPVYFDFSLLRWPWWMEEALRRWCRGAALPVQPSSGSFCRTANGRGPCCMNLICCEMWAGRMYPGPVDCGSTLFMNSGLFVSVTLETRWYSWATFMHLLWQCDCRLVI